ncbi:MAG TPA: hypothetical protein VN960_10955 [Gaiellaceae bacterium]|nr:hypothetical protein [Gaiellaceae bacterium]
MKAKSAGTTGISRQSCPPRRPGDAQQGEQRHDEERKRGETAREGEATRGRKVTPVSAAAGPATNGQ